MNIDAYLHQVHAATVRLRDIVSSINSVVENSINKKIDEIKKMLLFDTQLALSRVWSVDKFVELQIKSIDAQGRKLHEGIKEVENALQVLQLIKLISGFFVLGLIMLFIDTQWTLTRYLLPIFSILFLAQ